MAKKTTKEGKKEYYYGTGRRKSAVAQVRLKPDRKDITVNGKSVEDLKISYLKPLELVGMSGKVGLSIIVKGGGLSSQNEAIRLGISRAIIALDKSNKPTLRKAGFVTRDPRVTERKKPGLKKARRAPQWQKR